MKLKVGDKVRKNPETWIGSDFDSWGAGVGVGEVVEPPFELDEGDVDVRWPAGRCFQRANELIKVEE